MSIEMKRLRFFLKRDLGRLCRPSWTEVSRFLNVKPGRLLGSPHFVAGHLPDPQALP